VADAGAAILVIKITKQANTARKSKSIHESS